MEKSEQHFILPNQYDTGLIGELPFSSMISRYEQTMSIYWVRLVYTQSVNNVHRVIYIYIYTY